ncbi:MAG: hypothetical protein IH861_00955 [Chloroflexi bacterium]|nr:hypothetical protein [Chloroflexota bacterium]
MTTTGADLLDLAFHAIMTRMVQTGRAPISTELAATLGLDPGKARAVFSDLMATGYPGWLDEDGDIATLCPFSNRPNQYKISVEGEQKWFGQ